MRASASPTSEDDPRLSRPATCVIRSGRTLINQATDRSLAVPALRTEGYSSTASPPVSSSPIPKRAIREERTHFPDHGSLQGRCCWDPGNLSALQSCTVVNRRTVSLPVFPDTPAVQEEGRVRGRAVWNAWKHREGREVGANLHPADDRLHEQVTVGPIGDRGNVAGAYGCQG